MTSQPTPTTSISPGAASLLAVAVLASTALAGVVAAQAVAPVHVYLGGPVLLGVVATLSGGGFLAYFAVARVMRRLDQLEAKLDEQRDQGSVAEAAERINLRLLQGQG